MTIDQANTALAIASTAKERRAALEALAAAAFQAAINTNPDESSGYALQTRLIETRNVLTMAVQHIETNWTDGKGHHVANTLDLAIDHIQAAIEAL